jgi:hypothetical protein
MQTDIQQKGPNATKKILNDTIFDAKYPGELYPWRPGSASSSFRWARRPFLRL